MIDSIIAKYLKYNKRITIPELGTLVRKDSEGIFVLVEFLRKDDGVLAGLLRSESGLSDPEAATAISSYVSGIKEEVANHGSVSLKGIGILSLGNDGLYELDSVKTTRADDSRAQDRPADKSVRKAEPTGNTRKPDPNRSAKPAAKVSTRRAVTVDENGDPVDDDLFDTPQQSAKSSAVADSVASLFAGAKGLVNSVAGKINSSEDRQRRESARKAAAGNTPDDGDTEAPRKKASGRVFEDNSDKDSARSAKRQDSENKRFSDLKPQPEIRGLRYKSSGKYAKRRSPMDKILLIAIVAAIIAILVMLYAYWVGNKNKPEPLIEVQTEMPDIQTSGAGAE